MIREKLEQVLDWAFWYQNERKRSRRPVSNISEVGHELSSSKLSKSWNPTEPDIEPNEHEMAAPEYNAQAERLTTKDLGIDLETPDDIFSSLLTRWPILKKDDRNWGCTLGCYEHTTQW